MIRSPLMRFMDYSFSALLAVTLFAFIHLYAEKLSQLSFIAHSRFLSTGSGIAIAYIFIDLLPKLSKNDTLVNKAIGSLFFLDHHVYILALIGFLLFFAIDRSKDNINNETIFFWLSLSSYALFNFLIGYAVVDKNNIEVQPLILFTIAIALHYFMNDYSMSETHGEIYQILGRWILIAFLFLGWLIGILTEISETNVALISAFIGGGVIMNVTRHELPTEKANNLNAFLIGAFIYTVILLTIGK